MWYVINRIKNNIPYLAILNSSFIGYYLYHISAQWGKGKTRNILRNIDIRKLPFPKINYNSKEVQILIELVKEIGKLKKDISQLYSLIENGGKKLEIFRDFIGEQSQTRSGRSLS